RAEDRQARTPGGELLQPGAGALSAAVMGVAGGERHGLLLLAFLAADLLAGIAHALALVGLRRADPADAGGDLAHRLLVDAADLDLGLLGHGEADALRRLDVHVVREAELHGERIALHRRAVADADQLQRL